MLTTTKFLFQNPSSNPKGREPNPITVERPPLPRLLPTAPVTDVRPGGLWVPCDLARPPSCPQPWVPHIILQHLRACPRPVRPPPCLQDLQQPVTSDTSSPFVCFKISAYLSTLFGFLFPSVEPFPPRLSSISACDLGPCTPLAFASPARTAHSTGVLWDEPGCLL